MLNAELIKEMVSLCELFANGQNSGTITKETYTDKFKKPYLEPFEKKFSKSPNLLIQDELKIFYDSHIKHIDKKLLIKNFGYWGNNIYSYVWTCIYYDFDKETLPASYSPQLYILVNKMGIKFGFCYGHQVSENDKMVKVSGNKRAQEELRKLIKTPDKTSFFNSSATDITARPEVLFGPEEQIVANSVSDLLNNWTNKSLLIKEFKKSEIPINISENIQSTLLMMKDFYLSLLPIKIETNTKNTGPSENFNVKQFYQIASDVGLIYSNILIARLVASLCTKPFVILSGLSGSGKTKLAQAFAKWICNDEDQYCIVPVGADWTNREPLLGYPNALKPDEYIKPDNGALNLIINANNNPDLPYFLILDEMNLSHVERYFADFLSVMESGEEISLFAEDEVHNGVPAKLSLTSNLFIIGTVNIDETTYMFSPKVLDRANAIEFRVKKEEIAQYLNDKKYLKMSELKAKGATMAKSFLDIARNKVFEKNDLTVVNKTLVNFFEHLKKTGAEFGYRSASEIHRLINQLSEIDSTITEEEKVDIAIMQKLLPKLHGSRRKLCPVLITLGGFCVTDQIKNIEKEVFEADGFEFNSAAKVKYPISLEKIIRMYKGAVDNGFASYAEA